MRSFTRVLMVALAYAGLGVLGLTLAIPPNYASPVFPAAGLAVALVLLFGNRVLPGIAVGSLIINIIVAWRNGHPDMASVIVAIFVALGAILQAMVARILVIRWLGDRRHSLETEKDVGLFLFLAGPLSCLISATIATATLYTAGIISTAELMFSWWNWWTGDTLGVLVFAPLTLIFLLRAESPWKERQAVVAIPMLLTICLVVSAYLGVSQWERDQLNSRIADYGNRVSQLLDRRIVAHQEMLASLTRLIEVTPNMTFQQFEYFTRITLEDNKDLFALSFNPYILNADRQSFELVMLKRSPVANFRITERNSEKKLVPASVRSFYVSVGFIAPLEGNRPAIGFDINSEPFRRDAIERATKSGKSAVTAPIQLVQENKKRVGVLVLSPAYRKPVSASVGISPSLTGFAVGVIKVDEMVEIATRKEMREDILFRLTDPLANTNRRILYQSDGGRAKSIERVLWRSSLTMADRQWCIEVFPTAEYLRKNRTWLAWGTGVVGLLFTTLFQILMLATTGRTSVIRQKVLEQTVELTHAKEELELLNASLLQRVDKAISDLRQNDQILIIQGRQAAMGEMIGNIAHQWRQPLNALSMLIGNLQFAQKDNELTASYLDKAVITANRLIQNMSTTINDFRNFFRQDKEMVVFSAMEQIRYAVVLVETAFKNSYINILIQSTDDCRLHGFPNEYSQVLLNLLGNAKDAILASGVTEGEIIIILAKQDGNGVVTIRDNGKGIPEAIKDKIFEPYFSTKKMGSGIGLYMSKTIIEHNMKGVLTARNTGAGAEFMISIPLAGEAS